MTNILDLDINVLEKITSPFKKDGEITFKVDDVHKSNKKLFLNYKNEIDLTSIKETLETDAIGPTGKSIKVLQYSNGKNLVKLFNSNNSFIGMIATAFNEHLPMRITCNDIWLLILQGLSQHINKNSEELRHLFVNFKGKQEIKIFLDNFELESQDNEWDKITQAFLNKIEEKVTPAYFNLIKNTLSMSNQTVEIVNNIAGLSCFTSYFKLKCFYGCGFPEITLAGTTEDWLKIRAKINQIEELFYISESNNLTWWTQKLKFVVDEFINTSRGDVNVGFWKNSYKQITLYLSTRFNGWAGFFFPYVYRNKEMIRNPILFEDVNKFTINSESNNRREFEFTQENRTTNINNLGGETFPYDKFLSPRDIPSEISIVPITMVDIRDGRETETYLYGGFMGVLQDQDSLELKTCLGYALAVEKE